MCRVGYPEAEKVCTLRDTVDPRSVFQNTLGQHVVSACWGSGRCGARTPCTSKIFEEEAVVSSMPGLSRAERTTAVVIGAGLPGLAVATELRRRGVDSIIVRRAGLPRLIPGLPSGAPATPRRPRAHRRGRSATRSSATSATTPRATSWTSATTPPRCCWTRWARRPIPSTAGRSIPPTACCWQTTSSSRGVPTANCAACSRIWASPWAKPGGRHARHRHLPRGGGRAHHPHPEGGTAAGQGGGTGNLGQGEPGQRTVRPDRKFRGAPRPGLKRRGA